MMGIDLSKAFDCIDRKNLLNILEEQLSDEAMRIIQYLLSNTCMKCKVGKTTSESFQTNQEIPQGDALSPVSCSLSTWNTSCASSNQNNQE